MKGITFGYAILFTILLSFVLLPLMLGGPMVYGVAFSIGWLLILLYWFYGMIILNPEGYLGCV